MPGELMVSVVIVSWNARDYLLQCLRSLNAEVCRYPVEIVVVDNASKDGSPEMVQEQFPEVRLFRQACNLGFAKANNVGIAAATGRYLCLVNSDVRVNKDCITKLVDCCEANQKIGMAGPLVFGGDGFVQRSHWDAPSVWNTITRALALDTFVKWMQLHDCESQQQEPVDVLSGCFWLIRREALDQVGLLDEAFFMYGEDMDWCKRFWKGGWQVMFVPAADAIHYGGASSSNAPLKYFVERHRADLQYWRKHHSAFAVVCYIAITFTNLAIRAVGQGLASLVAGSRRQDLAHKARRSVAGMKWYITGQIPAAGEK